MQALKNKITENFFSQSLKSKNALRNGIDSIGYLCTYIPEEILISGGLNAVRIKGDTESSLSDGFLPINFCPYIKAVWEEIYKKNYSLKGTVFATSCDGMKRLNDLFLNYKDRNQAFMLDVPKNFDENSIDFFAGRLKKLFEFVKTLSPEKNIGPAELAASCEIMNKKRKLLSRLTDIYENGADSRLSTVEYFDILEISSGVENNVFLTELEAYISSVGKSASLDDSLPQEKDKEKNIEIMVIGNYINDHDFWKIFTDAGIRVISGDLCVGSRYFNFEVDLSRLDRITDNKESGSLLNAGMPKNNADNSGLIFRMIAENYLKKPLCFRMTSLDEKIKSTTEKIKAGNIKAVIFTSLKFCDNTLYFYPALKSELSKLDIPSLYLDIEYGKSSHGQLSTRIEAFCEMLF